MKITHIKQTRTMKTDEQIKQLAIKDAKIKHIEPIRSDYEDEDEEIFKRDFDSWEFMIDESMESFIDGYKAAQSEMYDEE